MKNNAHIETQQKRLDRFKNNPPYEIISTLLNSIGNFFNNEIFLAVQSSNYQTSLLFLGIHSVALTISEGLFNLTGHDGYKKFLEEFVDGNTADTKFSAVSQQIHDWRNVIAHQWIGAIGHTIGYDYDMKLGWETRGSVTFINPRIYAEQYLKAFGSGGKIWSWEKLLSSQEQEDAKQRLINKYLSK